MCSGAVRPDGEEALKSEYVQICRVTTSRSRTRHAIRPVSNSTTNTSRTRYLQTGPERFSRYPGAFPHSLVAAVARARRSATERFEHADRDPGREQQEKERNVFTTGRLPLRPVSTANEIRLRPRSASSQKVRTTPQRGRRLPPPTRRGDAGSSARCRA